MTAAPGIDTESNCSEQRNQNMRVNKRMDWKKKQQQQQQPKCPRETSRGTANRRLFPEANERRDLVSIIVGERKGDKKKGNRSLVTINNGNNSESNMLN